MAGVKHTVSIELQESLATGLELYGTDGIRLTGALDATPFPSYSGGWEEYGDWADQCLRSVIPASALVADASFVKVSIIAHSTENTKIDNMYIGHQGVGDVWDYDGNQVEVLFSAASGVDVPAGTTVESDATIFALDSSKNLVIGINVSDDSAKDGLKYDTSAPNAGYIAAIKANSSEAGDTAPDGFTSNTSRFAFVEKIDGVAYLDTSPATTAGWTALDKGELDVSTALCVVYKDGYEDGEVQAESSTDVKVRYYANGGGASAWMTIAAFKALSDIEITDTTESFKMEAQYISDGTYQSASRAQVMMDFTSSAAGAGGWLGSPIGGALQE